MLQQVQHVTFPYPFQPAANAVAADSEHKGEPFLRRERRLGGVRGGHASGKSKLATLSCWSLIRTGFPEPLIPRVPQGGPGAEGGGRGALPRRYIPDQKRRGPGKMAR